MDKNIFFILLFTAICINAQASKFAFKVGYYFPPDLKSGIMWGIDYGYEIDEKVSVVFGADLYTHTITDEADLGSTEELGVSIGVGQVLSEWSGWHLPLTAKARVAFGNKLKPFVTGGIGYGITNISVSTYNDSTSTVNSASMTYHGFLWQIGSGVLFQVGSRSNLIVEIMYNHALFDKSEENNIFTTLDSSGIVVRAGIDFAF